MTRRRFLLLSASILAVLIASLPAAVPAISAESLPPRLANQEFWKFVSENSEPSGTFHSDNLLSNEAQFQYIIPPLIQAAKPGRIYLGVGPEQNFSYIAAIKPSMVFIVDIRRGNLDLHLMYKALFEMSADRAEFVSLLFSRKRPAGLSSNSSAAEIFDAFAGVKSSQEMFGRNLKAIQDLLVTKHSFALLGEDLQEIEYIYRTFFTGGPDIQYQLNTGSGGFGRGGTPSYAQLMSATDESGRPRSYLASEDSFKFLKDLETRNAIVPLVGDFSGPKALRAVAAYLKQKGAVVSAFYLSNVEQYLGAPGAMASFCGNVAALPLDASSTFIRSYRGGGSGQGRTAGPRFTNTLGAMAAEVANGCGSNRRQNTNRP
jgi:hypothetical protein